MQSLNTERIRPSINDIELDGRLNRASSDRAQFELLLSMLESNFLDRPSYEDSDTESILVQDAPVNYYRNPILCADQDTWHRCNIQSQLIHSDLQNAVLWSTLHPQPLAIKNDAKQLDDEVIANCSIHIQQKLKLLNTPPENKHIPVEEIGLYDILQSMN